MRKYVVASIVLLPLLLSFSHAAQNWSVDPPEQPFVFSSEDSGTSSYLGVDISDVTTERLSALKLKEEKGVEVTMVDQDAPAGKAGIKEHDVILTMNGTAIESGAQLRRMIHETPPGRIVTLGLSRDGQPMTVKVQLADKHKEFSMMGPDMKNFHVQIPEIHIPDIDIPSINMVMVTSSARSGLSVENITPQLGEFFGVKNGNGVLVRAVEKGSRAEKAGFRAGDVIVKVNDQPVHDTGDFTHAVRSRNGAAISVGVIRDKKEQNLNLALPDRKESGDLLQEESSDDSAIDADSQIEVGELRNEIARLRPQMELAAENYRKSARELRKSACDQQKKFREDAVKEREQFKKQEHELRMQLDQMRRGMRRNLMVLRNSMDI
ncbi:MAG: PDZ domain-containing protein [Candidatus Sulfotelmatobacter sp.]|jgi:C-terminal processing protease CtpA/Prc